MPCKGLTGRLGIILLHGGNVVPSAWVVTVSHVNKNSASHLMFNLVHGGKLIVSKYLLIK